MNSKRTLCMLLCASFLIAIGAAAHAAAKDPLDEGKPIEYTFPPEHLLTEIPEVEPNNDPTSANTFRCGDVLRPAEINPAGDLDYIVFSTVTGATIQFGTDIDGATPVGDTVIDLIASDGTTVLATDDDGGPGLYSLINFQATYTGTYYGKIRGFASTNTGSYKAFVNCFDPVPPECELSGYKVETQTLPSPVAIPDNTPEGVLVGSITVAPDFTIFQDVVVAIRMDHTFVGDLIATVSYDVNCDGVIEASARVLCRPGRATCEGGTGFGCSSNLSCNNTYYFSDAGVGEIGVLPQGCGTTSTVIPSGCYLPNANGDPLSVFDGHEKGGCFTLHIADNAGGDTGAVCEWSVFMLNEPVLPVEPATWGQIKALHR